MIASIEAPRMSAESHNIRHLYGQCRLVRPARCVDVDPVTEPSAERAEKETDENWRDEGGPPQASQPKCRHIRAVSAIAGAAINTATIPTARKHLSIQTLALSMSVPSANWASSVNYFWATFFDDGKRSTRWL